MKTLTLAAVRCSLMFTAVAALSVVYPASVQAVPTTYQYTGNPFTTVSGPYTTSDFVTVMLTLASPLGANMPLTQVFPTAFTLFDGVQTITNLNATFSLFQFATGPTGAITLWEVLGENGAIPTIETGKVGPVVQDIGLLPTGAGQIRDRPGTWTVSGQVADTGSTLSLMALGLVARRFKRAAACLTF